MNNINYKVMFQGWNDEDAELALTFRDINSGKKEITVPLKILSDFRILSDKNPEILVFQNIDDVLITGNDSIVLDYVNYYVVLFKSKVKGKKEAILIGSGKNKNYLEILGTWPFNIEKIVITKAHVLELFDGILNNPKDYEHICLITS